MHENGLAAGASPVPRWGSLQRYPRPLAGGEGAGCRLLKNPTPLSTFQASGFGPTVLACYRPHLSTPQAKILATALL